MVRISKWLGPFERCPAWTLRLTMQSKQTPAMDNVYKPRNSVTHYDIERMPGTPTCVNRIYIRTLILNGMKYYHHKRLCSDWGLTFVQPSPQEYVGRGWLCIQGLSLLRWLTCCPSRSYPMPDTIISEIDLGYVVLHVKYITSSSLEILNATFHIMSKQKQHQYECQIQRTTFANVFR